MKANSGLYPKNTNICDPYTWAVCPATANGALCNFKDTNLHFNSFKYRDLGILSGDKGPFPRCDVKAPQFAGNVSSINNAPEHIQARLQLRTFNVLTIWVSHLVSNHCVIVSVLRDRAGLVVDELPRFGLQIVNPNHSLVGRLRAIEMFASW